MQNNSTILCGLDEAGRGSLAGPIVACAVILSVSPSKIERISGIKIRDGKLLSKFERDCFYQTLISTGSTAKTSMIGVDLINKNGISWANKELFRRLIRSVVATKYIVDGNLRIYTRKKHPAVISIIDADAIIPEVILAGIAAKVVRDRIMQLLHKRLQQYNWDKNAGYGTKQHINAIMQYGTTSQHRSLFVQTALSNIVGTRILSTFNIIKTDTLSF